MGKYYIYAERIFLKNKTVGPGYLEVVDGAFGAFRTDKPEADEIRNYQDCWIAPGFVDTHIHGTSGYDVMDNTVESIKEISKELTKSGVTSFLPTTLTADKQLLCDVAETIDKCWREVEGAKIQGIFYEGPFFTEKYKGAQNPIYFTEPDLESVNKWQELSGGLVKKVAVAPEMPGTIEFARKLSEAGITVAMGHSAATYAQAKEAVDAGASVFVHTFNGMSGFTHREPGMAGCAMATKETVSEVICDGFHVHPAAVKVLVDAKGTDQVALITDCMRAGNMPEGNYELGELPVVVDRGAVRLESNGSLAGSVLKMNKAVKNVVEWQVADAEAAIHMASYVPAKSVGIEAKCGSITEGHPADFVILNPNLEVLETWIDGTLVYQNKEEQEG